jgi:hypothetical protein
MKTTIKIEQEVDVKFMIVQANVRYWEDGEVNGIEDTEGDLMPCRDGDNWSPTIEIETGRITNWKQGTKASIHYKVCDRCFFQLQDVNDRIVIEVNGYVPGCLSPKRKSQDMETTSSWILTKTA